LPRNGNLAAHSKIRERNGVTILGADVGHAKRTITTAMLNRVNLPAGYRRAESGPVAPWEHARKAPRPRFEAGLTLFMILTTVVASILFARDMIETGQRFWDDRSWSDVGRLVLFAGIVLVLGYGNLVYQFSRLGYYVRLRRHRPVAYDRLIQATAGRPAPSVAVLVPSFREDPRTIRQTLLSAALQDYPNRRVVLLLDDPPEPTEPENIALLESARRAPAEIMAFLADPAGRARTAYDAFLGRYERGEFASAREIDALIVALAEADAWLAAQVAASDRTDHTDDLFVSLTYESARALLAQTMRRLLTMPPGRPVTFTDLDRDFRRLADLFQVEITTFERKRYANLSWEPNKAANLNAYLGVVGRRVQEVKRDGVSYLEFVGPDEWGDGSVVIPDATYILTLDADSLLSPDYARRLAGLMEAPGNERVAVAQTPYSAIPNPPGVLERIAGATTDLQYVVHQGFTWCNATFWVGANALLRKQALDEIRTDETERGFRVPKYIQDRTVIEDTESTVDLVTRGWRLVNYPERLAYSATPPDFGSLLIQRRRWANGGLLVLPKLWRYARTRPNRWRLLEILVRAHYLGSICGSSIGLFLLLFLPVEAGLRSAWLPLTAIPYFLLCWRDLLQAGYRVGDILRVYAFNILLLPINLAGVAKSIQQGITGKKIPFGRTPKVEGRTAAPRWAVLSEWALMVYCAIGAAWDYAGGREMEALFLSSTAVMLCYALVAFVGLRASAHDIFTGLSWPRPPRLKRLRRQARDSSPQAQLLPSVDPGGD
jgi:cellulose synthase/poly-beta-1,6-N-acetylglucosamine synthase-like glycosyltransferase